MSTLDCSGVTRTSIRWWEARQFITLTQWGRGAAGQRGREADGQGRAKDREAGQSWAARYAGMWACGNAGRPGGKGHPGGEAEGQAGNEVERRLDTY